MVIAIQRPLGNRMAAKHCPSCGGHLIASKSLNNEPSSKCQSCGAEVSVTQGGPSKGPPRATGGIIVRDMSGTKGKKQSSAGAKPATVSPADVSATTKLIRQAMTEKKVLSFSYRDAVGNVTFRQVEPYKLEVRNGQLVLFGFCLEKGAIRTFNISSMFLGKLETYTYEPKWPVEDLA